MGLVILFVFVVVFLALEKISLCHLLVCMVSDKSLSCLAPLFKVSFPLGLFHFFFPSFWFFQAFDYDVSSCGLSVQFLRYADVSTCMGLQFLSNSENVWPHFFSFLLLFLTLPHIFGF